MAGENSGRDDGFGEVGFDDDEDDKGDEEVGDYLRHPILQGAAQRSAFGRLGGVIGGVGNIARRDGKRREALPAPGARQTARRH